MNRAQRRAAGMKGKKYKKQQEETKQAVWLYLVLSGVAPCKAAAEAIYEMYRKEITKKMTRTELMTTMQQKVAAAIENTYGPITSVEFPNPDNRYEDHS